MNAAAPALEKRYEDFEIEVNECGCGYLEVRVLNSPLDRPRAEFRVPCGPDEFKEIMAHLDYLAPSGCPQAAEGRRQLSTQLGELLFERLFPPKILETLGGVRQSLLERGRQGGPPILRLRLGFHHAQGFRPTIAALPWELLRDPKEDFLVSTGKFTIERYQDAPYISTDDRRAEPPLRILGLFPRPQHLNETEGEAACRVLEEEFRTHKKVRFRALERPTLGALADLVETQRCHVLHYFGHGGFRDGEGYLSFEDDDGTEKKVTGKELARYLADAPWLRLVVLVGCRTWRTNEGFDPASGVASALVASGHPAVVAMRHPITIAQAQVFSKVFYEALAENLPVNLAMRKARMLMRSEDPKPHPIEWATPVLILRAQDPQLWDLRDREGNKQFQAGIMSRKDIREDFFRSFEIDTLDLVGLFAQPRALAEGQTWSQVAERVEKWVRQFDDCGARVLLNLACHLTIAYFTGFILSVERGVSFAVVQPGRHPISSWTPDGDPGADVKGWADTEEIVIDPGRPELAVAVGISSSTKAAVEAYLKRSGAGAEKAGTLWNLVPDGGPHQGAIRNGPHAARLAEALVDRIADWQVNHPGGVVHLFLNTPAGFALFLGQVAKKLNRVQLYEYDKEKGGDSYSPSLLVDSQAWLRG